MSGGDAGCLHRHPDVTWRSILTRLKVNASFNSPDVTNSWNRHTLHPPLPNGKGLERVSTFRLLGTEVHENVNWKRQINYKISSCCATIYKISSCCVTIYKSLILPHLDYCSAVWGCIGNGPSQKLEKLQNRAARIITGSSWDASSAPILHALKWDSLADRRVKQLKSFFCLKL